MSVVLVISARDNVATALEPLEPGQTIDVGGASLVVLEAIPRGHKVALRTLGAGEAVMKYGSAIGTASAPITAGAHVHTHNVASTRGRGDLGGHRHNVQAAAPAGSGDPSAPRIAEPPDIDQAGVSSTERS